MRQYLRGFFLIAPRPNFKEGRQWDTGGDVAAILIFGSIPLVIFAAGYFTARAFQ